MDIISICYVSLLKRILKQLNLPEPVYITNQLGVSTFLSFVELFLDDPVKGQVKHSFSSEPLSCKNRSKQIAAMSVIRGLQEVFHFKIIDINFSSRLHAEREVTEARKVNEGLLKQVKALEKEIEMLKEKNAYFLMRIVEREIGQKRMSKMEELDDMDIGDHFERVVTASDGGQVKRRTVFGIRDFPQCSTPVAKTAKHMMNYFKPQQYNNLFVGIKAEGADPAMELEPSYGGDDTYDNSNHIEAN